MIAGIVINPSAGFGIGPRTYPGTIVHSARFITVVPVENEAMVGRDRVRGKKGRKEK